MNWDYDWNRTAFVGASDLLFHGPVDGFASVMFLAGSAPLDMGTRIHGWRIYFHRRSSYRHCNERINSAAFFR
jgi:hypothetical protein